MIPPEFWTSETIQVGIVAFLFLAGLGILFNGLKLFEININKGNDYE